MLFEKMLAEKISKRLLCSVLAGILITSSVSAYCGKIMSDISSSVVRFHILANSDSEYDQQIKLKVRDGISEYVEGLLKDSKSAAETRKIISENLKNIEDYTDSCIKKYGCTYSAAAAFGNYKFPRREYENATFPGGNYNALKIVLGEGKGHNWWCVLYPQLCFSSSENGELSENGYSDLQNTLTKEEYGIITSKDTVKFKLKILEMFSD